MDTSSIRSGCSCRTIASDHRMQDRLLRRSLCDGPVTARYILPNQVPPM